MSFNEVLFLPVIWNKTKNSISSVPTSWNKIKDNVLSEILSTNVSVFDWWISYYQRVDCSMQRKTEVVLFCIILTLCTSIQKKIRTIIIIQFLFAWKNQCDDYSRDKKNSNFFFFQMNNTILNYNFIQPYISLFCCRWMLKWTWKKNFLLFFFSRFFYVEFYIYSCRRRKKRRREDKTCFFIIYFFCISY